MDDTNRAGQNVGLSALLGELRDRVLLKHGGPAGMQKGWNLTEGDSLLHKTAIDAIERLQRDAERYRWLRERDLETVHGGGVFAGMTPENLVLNGEDLDREIDAAMEHKARFISDSILDERLIAPSSDMQPQSGQDSSIEKDAKFIALNVQRDRVEERQPLSDSTPFKVKCATCNHVWTAAYTPMEMDLFANLIKSLYCPSCGGGSANIFIHSDGTKSITGSDQASHPDQKPSDMPLSVNLMNWLKNGDRGSSSNWIVAHLTGNNLHGHESRGDHPRDPGDFARCRNLLEQVPELQPLFNGMAVCSGPWAELVAHWKELGDLMDLEAPHWRNGQVSAPKTYKRMRDLIDAGRQADG